ncbi:RHS repeat-associated core domain-containing protein [Streptomyces angustmyceticus]|uniref:RHS repeat-associated core domain-containing protein n=1 Tax=Streptomyces angustmyceticus TaxID=285578 RepID=UPI003D91017D
MLPGWADELLDLIGVSWPNVDEDDYRSMADAMREFADDIDEGANEAHTAIQSLVGSAGGSLAVEALNAHWGKINGQHLKGLADCGRMAATAMDGVALLIEGAKIGALVQLGILAAEVIAAQAAAPFTLGLSELGALGATQATRMVLKRLFKEVCQQVAEQVVSIALTPVEEALGAMVGDLVVQLGGNALGVKDGFDLGQTAKAGKEGFSQGAREAKGAAKSAAANPMELLSAGGRGSSSGSGGGSSTGGGDGFSFDKDEHDRAVTSLESAGGTFRNKAGGKIGRARSHHGRTRGKDFIADAANTVLDKVIDGIEDGVKKTAKHLDDNMTRGIKQMAKNHHENDQKLSEHFKGLGKEGKKEPRGPHGSSGTSLNSARPKSKAPLKSEAAKQADADHPHDKTRKDDGKCTDGTDPVDLASGKVFLSQTDVVLAGSLPLAFTRKYESSTRLGRHLAPSWLSTVDQRLEIDASEVVFVTESGMLLRYGIPEVGQRVLPKNGPRWPLMRTEQGDWVVHEPDTGLSRYFSDALHTPGLALPDEITDRNGHRIAFDFLAETGTPSAIRHSAGYELKLTCDEHARLSAVHLAGAGQGGSDQLVMSYGHDDAGNLITVTQPSGAVTRFEYDSEHRMIAWVDSNDSRYEYSYDHRHRCTAQSGVDGHLSNRFTYDAVDPATGHRTTTATDSDGHTTRYLINDRLQVVAAIDPLGNTTRTERDAQDRLTAVIDPLGRTTRFTYDTDGRLSSVTHPDGSRATATYNALGLPIALTEPDGSVWRQEYDDKGNRTSLTDPVGATTSFVHDQHGMLSAVIDPLGHTTRLTCDAAGLPLVLTDPLGADTRVVRDGWGRVIAVTDPLGSTTHSTWTVEGRLSSRTDPTGAVERWTYDGEGNLLAHADAVGQVTSYEYTHFDLLTARTDPDGMRYEFAHDSRLRLKQVTNPQQKTWDYSYDAAGRLISESDFDGRVLKYTYDRTGLLDSRTDALGQTTRFLRDVLGRMTTRDAEGQVTTYTHHGSHVLRAVGPDATITYERDALGRVLSETVNGRTLRTAYDIVGRPVRRTTPTGHITTYTYDAAGHRTALNASGRSLAFTHDQAGREVHRDLGGEATLTSAWDPRGRLTSQVVAGSRGSAEPLQHRTYSYRADGQLVSLHDRLAGSQRTFSLDPMGRVTSVRAAGWSESYAYDEIGNQTHAHWPDRHPGSAARGDRAYSGTRLTRAGSVRYEHDALGRTTLRQKTRLSRRPDTWHYTWDSEDRLSGVTTPDGTRWRYRYDPLGRRIAKERLGLDQCAVVERTEFTWDGTVLAEQVTYSPRSANAVVLTWDHNGLVPVAQTERKARVPAGITDGSVADGLPFERDLDLRSPSSADGSLAGDAHADPREADQALVDERFFAIITDLVGTPTELVSEFGEIAWHTRATLWGATTWSHSSTAYTPLRFAGQYFDSETALHYNYFRHYDPETGRYLSADPLGFEAADNPVTYVSNPHRLVDPYGLAPCPPDGQSAHGSVPSARGTPGGRAPVVELDHAQPGWSQAERLSHLESRLPAFALFSRSAKTANRTYVGAMNTDTGDIALASSGGGYCAEGNALLHLGGDPGKVLFTSALTVRSVDGSLTALPKPVCHGCQGDYPDRSVFLPGVVGEPDGPWGD